MLTVHTHTYTLFTCYITCIIYNIYNQYIPVIYNQYIPVIYIRHHTSDMICKQ